MIFKVSKGSHIFRSNRLKGFGFFRRFAFFKKSLRFRVLFTSDCFYELSTNKGQINKLYGYGHKLRIGWTGEGGKIVLYWYKDSDSYGDFETSRIQEIEVGKYVEMEIPIREWYFRIFTWLNYPYFGGKAPAPKEMYIHLDFDW